MANKTEKEINEAYDSYDTIKEILNGADQEINEVFIDIIRATLEWVRGDYDD